MHATVSGKLWDGSTGSIKTITATKSLREWPGHYRKLAKWALDRLSGDFQTGTAEITEASAFLSYRRGRYAHTVVLPVPPSQYSRP